jgi:4-oxalocrotonate tautomerase
VEVAVASGARNFKESHHAHHPCRPVRGPHPEQKKNLVAALTQACVDALGSKPESVDVLLFDVKPSDWATGGVLWSEKN